MSDKKVTIKDRKKAQPKAVTFFSPEEKAVILKSAAKDLNDTQANIFLYTCQALGLNPLLNEIAVVTYRNSNGTRDMSIQVMRDGFLTIAHRSGKFAGLESGIYEVGDKNPYGKEIKMGKTAWAKAYNKDFQVPVYQEADFTEYNTGKNLWVSKPNTMIKKVAESMALRKAFNINGVYAPEEMEKEIQPIAQATPLVEDGKLATEAQKENIRNIIDYKKMSEKEKKDADLWINELTYIGASAKTRELVMKPKEK
jgi:phage recombination protein Bet